MKTIKIFLSIAGFALSTFCFGQQISQNNSDVLFYSSYYNLASNQVEHHVYQFPARLGTGDHFEAPLVSKTFFTPIEFEIGIEAWMTTPFESNFYEEEQQIESWMLAPFESSYYEEDIVIESWMTQPFESGAEIEEVIEEEIEIEEWMTTPWI